MAIGGWRVIQNHEKKSDFFFFPLTQPEGLWEFAIRHDEMKIELSQRVDYG